MLPVKRFTDFIEQNNLFNKNSTILAAVSGGMDSVLMAHLLKLSGYNFGIAHCNFQLRGNEADKDQDFCMKLASQLEVDFHTVKFDTADVAASKKISIQMAARELRYQWFYQTAAQHGYHTIALAHHQNDTIETILLNLTRGTGIAGLHGILPKAGLLVRPLLFLGREEIETVVAGNQLAYVEDSSNSSAKYARNKLRLEVIPKLKELNPSLEKTFEENLSRFRDLEMLLEEQLKRLKKELVILKNDEIHLQVESVKKLNPPHLLLFGLLQPYGFNGATITDILGSLDKHSGKFFETATYTLVLDRENLILKKKGDNAPGIVPIEKDDHSLQYGDYRLTVLNDESPLIIRNNPMATSVDAALLIYPLIIRAWQHGDFFYPLGMRTKKKLSDFFIHEKISLLTKPNVPLIINGNGDVIWVGGYRPDERYKVSRQTKKVTIFELIKL